MLEDYGWGDILDDGEIMEASGVGPGAVEVSRIEIVQAVLGDKFGQLFLSQSTHALKEI